MPKGKRNCVVVDEEKKEESERMIYYRLGNQDQSWQKWPPRE
jgi:hypothetical protein